MTVKRKAVARNKPHKATMGEDDEHADVEGLAERLEALSDLRKESLVVLRSLQVIETLANRLASSVVTKCTDESPNDAGHSKQNGGEEVRVVVSKDANQAWCLN
jgi:hypothetical protein